MAKQKYTYKVVKTESPHYKLGYTFVTKEKFHDNRRKDKTRELSDKNCKSFFIKCIKEEID